MGSTDFYPEERPVVESYVAPFEIDRYAVTNTQFADFVEATAYLTVAERQLDPASFGNRSLANLDPGSLVFVATSAPVDLGDWRQWWQWVPGASWRHPRGPDSDLTGLELHPVVHIAYDDAIAYAQWVGKRLPTESEWEYAARGGLSQATFAWGEGANTGSSLMANTWQGRFPYLNTGANGWVGTAPVGAFPPNGFGLFDMTGNTWEWTADYWTERHADPRRACTCGPSERRVSSTAPGEVTPRRVLKGGSHLCSPDYCLRYRPAARSAQSEDSATTHLGFRCAK